VKIEENHLDLLGLGLLTLECESCTKTTTEVFGVKGNCNAVLFCYCIPFLTLIVPCYNICSIVLNETRPLTIYKMYLMFYVNLLFFVCIKKQFTFFFSFHLGVSRSCSSVSGYNNCVKTKVMGIKGVSCSCSTNLCNGSGAIGQFAALVAMGLIVVIKLL